jgi:hypothetical protein
MNDKLCDEVRTNSSYSGMGYRDMDREFRNVGIEGRGRYRGEECEREVMAPEVPRGRMRTGSDGAGGTAGKNENGR